MSIPEPKSSKCDALQFLYRKTNSISKILSTIFFLDLKIIDKITCVIKSFSYPFTSQSSSFTILQIHHPGLHKFWNWRNFIQSNKKQKISDSYYLKRWWTLHGKIFETGADISTRKNFIFFLKLEGFLYHLCHLSAGHVNELYDMLATKY